MIDREVTSELSSSVSKGVGYDEVFPSGREPREDYPWSPEREPSTQSLSDENEEKDEGDVEEDDYDKGEVDEEDREDEDGEDDDGTHFEGRDLEGQADGGARPFILPAIWTVYDFYPTMTINIFKNLRDRYQVPKNVPILLARKFKQCYSGKTANVGMYDAMFAVGLKLPLTELHR